MQQATKQAKPALGPRSISRRQFMQWTAIGLSTAAVLAACAPPGVEQPATGSAGTTATITDTAASGAAQTGGKTTQVWLGHQEVASLSPDDTGPTVQGVLIQNIHSGLIYYDYDFNLVQDLAESHEVAPDGLKYTFHLRKGVKFHDGSDFTSKDVKYTFDFYRDEKNGAVSASSFTGIDTIETPDDATVVVNMKTVNAASLVTWGGFNIVPAKYHAEIGEAKYKGAPIGTGPYKVKEWKASEFTELEAFADYWGGRAKIDFLRLEVVPEDAVRKQALVAGDADASVWPLLVQDSLTLEKDPKFKILRSPGASIKFFPINNTLPFFQDKLCRQALMYALDRQRIIDDLWNGTAEVAHSNIPPSSKAYYKADLKQYEFSPDKAKQLLDEAGWKAGADGIREKDGKKFSFTCTAKAGDQARKAIAELAQQLFKDVGVDMQIAEAPIAAILEGLRKGDIDCSIFNWTYCLNALEPDPSDTLSTKGGNNFSHFSNAEMDKLIADGLQKVDPKERKPFYDRIQEIFVEEVTVLYLQFDQWLEPFARRLEGVPDSVVSAGEWIDADKWTKQNG
ncbi:MAG: ABC transporter substrate-binding protein [Chloroflexi bacterium]|nr:ABC transporter substrate-binding protein [Chloroflexota bacterium]